MGTREHLRLKSWENKTNLWKITFLGNKLMNFMICLKRRKGVHVEIIEEIGNFDPLRGPKFNPSCFQPATASCYHSTTHEKERTKSVKCFFQEGLPMRQLR